MSAARKFDDEYFSGNAVRKLQTVPEIDHRREEQREEYLRRQREAAKRQRRQLEKANNFDLLSLSFFTIALLFTVLAAIHYLQVQAQQKSISEQITAVQKEILAIRDENSAMKDSITELPLSEVYRIATEELGMVHPSDNQIVTYDSKKQDYLKQFDNIPEGVTTDIIGEILNK